MRPTRRLLFRAGQDGALCLVLEEALDHGPPWIVGCGTGRNRQEARSAALRPRNGHRVRTPRRVLGSTVVGG